jgi:hypothetical protein
LNKLNEQLARDQGVKVSDLAVKDEKAEATTTEKADAKKTTAKK